MNKRLPSGRRLLFLPFKKKKKREKSSPQMRLTVWLNFILKSLTFYYVCMLPNIWNQNWKRKVTHSYFSLESRMKMSTLQTNWQIKCTAFNYIHGRFCRQPSHGNKYQDNAQKTYVVHCINQLLLGYFIVAKVISVVMKSLKIQ